MHRVSRFCCCATLILAGPVVTSGQTTDPIPTLLRTHQSDLAADGLALLRDEARRASFLLIGALHGDNETQALVEALLSADADGYRLLTVEMSPWAAARLEASQKSDGTVRLRGSDIEEIQPHLIIRELALANPQNGPLQTMTKMTQAGYRRSIAPDLLRLARQLGDVNDVAAGGVSLRTLMLKTLEVEDDRLRPDQEWAASVRRETFMKELFLTHYREAGQGAAKPKVAAVFGRNHLHRGFDRRGVSTLGNFIAELAVAEGVQAFHLAVFAAGGRIMLGKLREIDERKDDPAFELLASVARYPAALFDLRPIRQALRAIPIGKRSARDANLLYWADSYDAIVCYREVTPLGVTQPGG